MQKLVSIGVLLMSIYRPLAAQEYKISISPVYGTYQMSSMKTFQRELYEDIASSIDVPFKITDNFPAFIGYELNLGMSKDRLEYGIQLSTRSTGGRISYSDYSGKYNIDNSLTNIEVSAFGAYQSVKSDRFELALGGMVGLAFTNHTLFSIFQLTGKNPQEENFKFSSINIIVAPTAKLRYYIMKRVFAELNTRYDIHIPGKLVFSENKDAYLLDNNNNEVKANWSGVRSGIGLGVKF